MKSGWHVEWDAYVATAPMRAEIARVAALMTTFMPAVTRMFESAMRSIAPTTSALRRLVEKLEGSSR